MELVENRVLSKESKWTETMDAQSVMSFMVALGRERHLQNGLCLYSGNWEHEEQHRLRYDHAFLALL